MNWLTGLRTEPLFADTELKVLADSARMRGLQTEARILNPRTPEALESLARKARELKLDERFAMELQFEGMWLQVTTMIRDGQPDPAALASTVMQISRKFPGAETPLAKWIPVDLQKAEVLNEYAAADDANRKLWHRQLMIAATAAEIQARLLSDGRNGVELAEEWRIRLPERANESQTFLDRYDAFRMARLKTMTREELLAFTKDLEARKKPTSPLKLAGHGWNIVRNSPSRKVVQVSSAWLKITARSTTMNKVRLPSCKTAGSNFLRTKPFAKHLKD